MQGMLDETDPLKGDFTEQIFHLSFPFNSYYKRKKIMPQTHLDYVVVFTKTNLLILDTKIPTIEIRL